MVAGTARSALMSASDSDEMLSRHPASPGMSSAWIFTTSSGACSRTYSKPESAHSSMNLNLPLTILWRELQGTVPDDLVEPSRDDHCAD